MSEQHKVQFRPIIGSDGKNRLKWHDVEILMLDGKQIATINKVPGSSIALLGGRQLTPSEHAAVESAVAKARGGVKPKRIGGQVKLPYELLDDEQDTEGDDTEFDEDGDE